MPSIKMVQEQLKIILHVVNTIMCILEQCEQIRNSLVSDISVLHHCSHKMEKKYWQRWSATKKDLLINEDEQRGGTISQIQISVLNGLSPSIPKTYFSLAILVNAAKTQY